ncbi:MAG: hypothetical protein V4617_15020 [Gemmatimonadota bacterium]
MPKRRKAPAALVQLRSRFKTALAEAGLTMAAWAELNGWSRAHVVLVLAADRESEKVLDAVRAFTGEQEDVMRKRLAIAS